MAWSGVDMVALASEILVPAEVGQTWVGGTAQIDKTMSVLSMWGNAPGNAWISRCW